MMRYTRTVGLLIVTLVVFAGVASATSLADIGTGTISIGDKTFGDFSLTCATGNCAVEGITAGNIQVGAFIDNGVYYLQFTGDMISSTAIDFILRYTVSASAGLITMIDQSFNLSTTGGGNIIIGEDVRSGSFFGTIVANSSISFFDLQDPSAEVGDDLIIDPGLAKVWVTKDVSLSPAAGGSVGTSVLTQSFHQTVPEPTSLILLGTGLAGLAVWRKRSKY